MVHLEVPERERDAAAAAVAFLFPEQFVLVGAVVRQVAQVRPARDIGPVMDLGEDAELVA